MIDLPFSPSVDILLILEGTYPFVRGGVSTWVHDLVSRMPEYRFGIVFLGAYASLYKHYEYDMPKNVTNLQMVFLFDEKPVSESKPSAQHNKKAFAAIQKLHDIYRQSHGCPHALASTLPNLVSMLQSEEGIDYYQFLHSQAAWDYITNTYEKYSGDPAFVNYFWNVRNMHAPLWPLVAVVPHIPKTKVVHTVSTGYSGLLAVMLRQYYQYPVILTEHGLYTKERDLELLQSRMFASTDSLLPQNPGFSHQHQSWLYFFDSLARTCYQYADPIISLFRYAQDQQIAAGADAAKTRVVANGVDLQKFAPLIRAADAIIPKTVCFVGRFVRIKDLKTFIRAVGVMLSLDPDIVAYLKVVGDPDQDYLQECKEYIHLLGLTQQIQFIAGGDMFSILQQTGVLILSSISEGMPLVLLESMAAGIPVIATHAGACREIIEGKDAADKALGPCGAVVSIANANEIAEAAVDLLKDRKKWFAASQAGIQRVEKYYEQSMMIKAYQDIYQEAIYGRDRD